MGASNHRSDGLRIFGVMPEIEKLYGDRFRLTFRCDTKGNVEDWYYRNKSDLFTEFGTLMDAGFGTSPETPDPDSTWPNQRLIEHGLEYLQGKETPIVKFIYETLTDTFVEETQEKVDYTEKGLRIVTRTLIARDSAIYRKGVGEDTIAHTARGRDTITLTLAKAVEAPLRANEGSFIRIQETWVEPGRIQTSTQPGRVEGTKEVTIVSEGVQVVPDGVKISEREDNEEGYPTFTTTVIQGTIEGTKTSWTDVVDVTVPGTVDLVTRSVTAGPLDGTVAVINNTPPRSKKIAATVTVEVTTTPPTDTSRAYDLGSISCSVDATQANYAALGTDVFETKSGNQRFSGAKGRGSISARIVSFPGSYLLNSGPVSGSFSYIGGWENSSTSPNTLLTNALTSSITNTLSGNGSTSESDFSTSGILQRKVRPIITALDGTIYWEVVTWRV